MFLDTFKLRTVIFQLQYPHALEIWDRSGAVGRHFSKMEPELVLQTAEPNRVSLRAPGLEVRTEIDTAIIAMSGSATTDARTAHIRNAVAIWKRELELHELKRVSMRTQYTRTFSSLREANALILSLNLIRMPAQKVFDQPTDGAKNGVEINFRFEDENTFTTLNIKAESLNIKRESHVDFPEIEAITLDKHRVIIDFDRGTLKPMQAQNLNSDEWVKGYFHVLRRDIEKVLLGAA